MRKLKVGRKLLNPSVLVLLALTMVAAYSYTASLWGIESHGTIVLEGVEVYWDKACTLNATVIEWGRLRPGDNKTVVVYVKNVGNERSSLTLWTGNWSSPEADRYLSLSWNYTGYVLNVSELIPVELTLIVAPDIQDVHDFSFDIGIAIATVEE